MEQLKKITKELLPDWDIFTGIFTQNGELWGSITGLFGHLGDLFKKTKDSIIGIGQEGLDQLAGWGIGGAGSAAGGAGSAAGGAGGSSGSAGAAGAASSGLTAVVTAISSAATAISSVVGNFQMAGMNRTLDLIEKEVRYSQIHLETSLNLYNRYLPKLEGFEQFNYNVVAPAWYDLLAHLDNYLPRSQRHSRRTCRTIYWKFVPPSRIRRAPSRTCGTRWPKNLPGWCPVSARNSPRPVRSSRLQSISRHRPSDLACVT
jgi:hypothetical protein